MERKNLEFAVNNSKLERKIDAISTGILTGGMLSAWTYACAYMACHFTSSTVCKAYNDSSLLELAIPSVVGILAGLGFGYSAYNDKHDGAGFL